MGTKRFLIEFYFFLCMGGDMHVHAWIWTYTTGVEINQLCVCIQAILCMHIRNATFCAGYCHMRDGIGERPLRERPREKWLCSCFQYSSQTRESSGSPAVGLGRLKAGTLANGVCIECVDFTECT